MTCTCPKCKTELELSTAEIPADGLFDKCSTCNTSFLVKKESFARRALYNSTEISCAECGNAPGTAIFCQSCHAIYPELLTIETITATKKQLGKIIATLNVLKNFKPGVPKKSHQGSYRAPTPVQAVSKGLSLPGLSVQIAVILAILISIIGGAGYFWYQNNIADKYTDNYLRAILMVKTTRDFEVKLSNRLIASWKAGTATTLAAADVKAITSAEADVNTLMKRLGKVPDKFTTSNNAIIKLHENFEKLHSTVKATTGTVDSYAAKVNGADAEFKKSAGELKASLPGKISVKFNKSREKYKDLQDF